MREFVSFLIPRRRACDTIADAASAQGRFHPAASQTPRDLVQSWLACRPPSASEIGLSRAFCNSIKNANASIAATRLVRVTHPFHPLSGQQLVRVGERYNRYGMTLLLEAEDGSVCSVSPQWTDLVAPDPEIVMGERRALFRVVDLLELAHLVDRLRRGDARKG